MNQPGQCDFDKYNDILVLDVEATNNETVSPATMADTLYNLIQGLYHIDINKVYIYYSPNYWRHKVYWQQDHYNILFSKCLLWITYWGDHTSPDIPDTWETTGWTWWQYSSTGKISGITDNVDLNRMRTSSTLTYKINKLPE